MRCRPKDIELEFWENKPQEHTNEFPAWLLQAIETKAIQQENDQWWLYDDNGSRLLINVGDFIIRGDLDELITVPPGLFLHYFKVI